MGRSMGNLAGSVVPSGDVDWFDGCPSATDEWIRIAGLMPMSR